jgi:hypothetical protein
VRGLSNGGLGEGVIKPHGISDNTGDGLDVDAENVFSDAADSSGSVQGSTASNADWYQDVGQLAGSAEGGVQRQSAPIEEQDLGDESGDDAAKLTEYLADDDEATSTDDSSVDGDAENFYQSKLPSVDVPALNLGDGVDVDAGKYFNERNILEDEDINLDDWYAEVLKRTDNSGQAGSGSARAKTPEDDAEGDGAPDLDLVKSVFGMYEDPLYEGLYSPEDPPWGDDDAADTVNGIPATIADKLEELHTMSDELIANDTETPEEIPEGDFAPSDDSTEDEPTLTEDSSEQRRRWSTAAWTFEDGSLGDGLDIDATAIFGPEPPNYDEEWGPSDSGDSSADTVESSTSETESLISGIDDTTTSDIDSSSASDISLETSDESSTPFDEDASISTLSDSVPDSDPQQLTKRQSGSSLGDGLANIDTLSSLFGSSEPDDFEPSWQADPDWQDQRPAGQALAGRPSAPAPASTGYSVKAGFKPISRPTGTGTGLKAGAKPWPAPTGAGVPVGTGVAAAMAMAHAAVANALSANANATAPFLNSSKTDVSLSGPPAVPMTESESASESEAVGSEQQGQDNVAADILPLFMGHGPVVPEGTMLEWPTPTGLVGGDNLEDSPVVQNVDSVNGNGSEEVPPVEEGTGTGGETAPGPEKETHAIDQPEAQPIAVLGSPSEGQPVPDIAAPDQSTPEQPVSESATPEMRAQEQSAPASVDQAAAPTTDSGDASAEAPPVDISAVTDGAQTVAEGIAKLNAAKEDGQQVRRWWMW